MQNMWRLFKKHHKKVRLGIFWALCVNFDLFNYRICLPHKTIFNQSDAEFGVVEYLQSDKLNNKCLNVSV